MEEEFGGGDGVRFVAVRYLAENNILSSIASKYLIIDSVSKYIIRKNS